MMLLIIQHDDQTFLNSISTNDVSNNSSEFMDFAHSEKQHYSTVTRYERLIYAINRLLIPCEPSRSLFNVCYMCFFSNFRNTLRKQHGVNNLPDVDSLNITPKKTECTIKKSQIARAIYEDIYEGVIETVYDNRKSNRNYSSYDNVIFTIRYLIETVTRVCFIYQPNPALVFSKKGIFYIQMNCIYLSYMLYICKIVYRLVQVLRSKWNFKI